MTEALKRTIAAGRVLTCYLSRRGEFLRFLIARTGSPGEADDVLQDLYLRIRTIPAGKEIQVVDPAAFLFRLCLNLVIDRRRSDIRRERREQAFQGVHLHVAGGEAVADQPSPESSANAQLLLDRVRGAIEAMPPQQRRVFRLHRVEGLTHAEISEALGISRSAVEKHMIAALKRLASWRN